MNYVEYGRKRDEKIVQLVTQGSMFTRTQIQRLLFRQKDATRKAQLRLRVLSDTGRINKFQRGPHEPTIYYCGKLSKRMVDHTILVNEVYTQVMLQKKSHLSVTWHWEYTVMGKIRADAMIDVYDILAKRRHVIFVEVERYADHRFSKDKSYASVATMGWENEAWAIRDSTCILFPAVLVVTDTPLKFTTDLDITVATMEQVKTDVFSLLLRR